MRNEGKLWHRAQAGVTWPGTGAVLLLALAGCVVVWSASWRSAEFGRGYHLNFYLRQILWVAVGVSVYIGCLSLRRKAVETHAYLVYGLLFLLLLSVIFVGRSVNGSKRWIVLGPLQVQPSEFMKLGVILALGRYLAAQRRLDRFRDLIVPFALVLLPMAFILRQPDLGTSLVLVPVCLAQLYAAGASPRKLGAVVLVMAALAPFSYHFLLKDYQKKRVDAFLGQGSHSREQRIGEAYQLIQSKVAIGSGGVWGKGLNQGTQNRLNFTPFRHTDFIFAVVGEEWGFAGALGLLLLYLLSFTLAIAVAYSAATPFDRIVVTGITTALAFQVFVNTAMAVGLAPITGLTLPFLSYGGSSMVMAFASFGLIAGARSARVTGERPGPALAVV